MVARTIRLTAASIIAGAATTGALLAVAAAADAQAAPAPNASVLVDTVGMRYTGLAGANAITVKTSGARFIVTDTAPITAGAGCATFAPGGKLFGVFCSAPKTSTGLYRKFFVQAGGSNDVVTNLSAAPMQADGGVGNDVLNGGAASDTLLDAFGSDALHGNGGSDNLLTDLSNDGLPDTLDGGAGDDDLQAGNGNDTLRGGTGIDVLRGGLGKDTLDAGSDSGDTVTYLENAHDGLRVVASLDGLANDGAQAIGTNVNEGDNIVGSPGILVGGSGPNVLFGNAGNNHLVGQQRDDILIGGKGADFIEGFGGNDTLASNDLFGAPVKDGAIDTLDGGDGVDSCRIPFITVEPDITINCENINQD
jgi:Ca2+-binding RTX toxin-like protein